MKFLLSISILLLSACGFKPMYGTVGSNNPIKTQKLLNQVDIALIPDREGQYLRNLLIDNFYTAKNRDYLYTLHTEKIKEKKINLDITKNADATRSQLRLETKITLTSNITGETLLSNKIRATTSYNILSSQFTTKISEENARNNALNDLARQIKTRISLFLRK